MLTVEDIKQAIKELEDGSRLTGQTCEQLVWLYFLKDKMSGQSTKELPSQVYKARAVQARTQPVTSDHLTKELAEAWTAHMENADGTVGPHWTLEQSKQVQAQRGLPGDPVAFWAVINSVYSDYSAVARKYGSDNVNFYADLANAWLEDSDAVEGKALAYYENVVSH
jgi:hypothetical protein